MRSMAPLIALVHAPLRRPPAARRAVCGEAAPLPLEFVAEALPDLPDGHLHMLVSPGEVAAAITDLAGQAQSAASSLRSLR